MIDLIDLEGWVLGIAVFGFGFRMYFVLIVGF